MNFKEEFLSLIELYPDDIDTYLNDPIDTDRLIGFAEALIGYQFPNSYKDFLHEFGYAVIFGEEIYSLYSGYYENDRDCSIGYPFDIACNNVNNRKRRDWDGNLVKICHTGLDDQLFFDYRFFHKESGECDIFVLWPGSPLALYAKDFYEFLCKRIYEHVK